MKKGDLIQVKGTKKGKGIPKITLVEVVKKDKLIIEWIRANLKRFKAFVASSDLYSLFYVLFFFHLKSNS